MRLTPLALVALLALAGCGGDEPDEAADTPPVPAPQRPAADTTVGDTVALDSLAEAADTAGPTGGEARPGQGDQPAPDEPATGADRATSTGQRAAGGRLYTVQVAAFTDPASATEWAGRLRRQGLPVWTSMAETGGRTFYRVRVGAVPTFSEARRLGSMVAARYEWPVWVAPVGPADQVPDDAVEATRRVLQP